MSNVHRPITLGSLVSKDLPQCHILPSHPSSYNKEFRFYNDYRYIIFDYPPPPLSNQYAFAWRLLPITGDECSVLVEKEPEHYLKEHWKEWLPTFPAAVTKPVTDGIADAKPIMTTAAMQGMPAHKHSVHPDVLYKINLKSTIPEMRVPCPKHMTEDDATFPCMVKVDMSWGGLGNRRARNKDELSSVIQEIRDQGWKQELVIQEFIQDFKKVITFEFYIFKTGEIYWLSTHDTYCDDTFHVTYCTVDWKRQDEDISLAYEDIIVPVKIYLHHHRYFGIVNLEVLFSNSGHKYVVDMNARISGSLQHSMMCPYMAEIGFTKSAFMAMKVFHSTAADLVKHANHINQTNQGKMIICSAIDVSVTECQACISVFAESFSGIDVILEKLASLQ